MILTVHETPLARGHGLCGVEYSSELLRKISKEWENSNYRFNSTPGLMESDEILKLLNLPYYWQIIFNVSV